MYRTCTPTGTRTFTGTVYCRSQMNKDIADAGQFEFLEDDGERTRTLTCETRLKIEDLEDLEEDLTLLPPSARFFKMSMLRHVFKISFLLILLPFWLTLQHFLGSLQRTSVVVVSPASAIQKLIKEAPPTFLEGAAVTTEFKQEVVNTNTSPPSTNTRTLDSYYGLYRAATPHYFQHASPAAYNYWPSIVDIGTTVRRATIAGPTRDNRSDDHLHVIYWKNDLDCWCLDSYCSKPPIQPRGSNVAPPPPPTGIWSNDNGNMHIMVRHLGRASSQVKNRNLHFVLTKPATTLLLSLLIGLAFYYWNYAIDPSKVSKSFSKIVHQHEYYRAFTGATAHFEAIHLGFNGMALYSLGMQLEEQMGSISFLFYNISLIPITTLIMMAMIGWQVRRTGNTALAEQSAVGYSGVLFAWMVVASLNSDKPTCPIPLFDDVCFNTYNMFLGIKVNLGPVVQLIVAQVLLRRASFVGHLAGLVAGFCVHWRLLPLVLVQPAVLIPALYCLKRQGSLEAPALDALSNTSTFAGWLMWRGYLLLIGLGIYVGLHWSLLLPLIFQTILLYYSKLNDTATWWKALIISSILGVLTDSMTSAGWLVLGDLYCDNTWTGWFPVAVYMVMRILWQVTMLTIACSYWNEKDIESGGIFVTIFGATVLDSGAEIGKRLRGKKIRPDIFEGRGIPLGGPSQLLV